MHKPEHKDAEYTSQQVNVHIAGDITQANRQCQKYTHIHRYYFQNQYAKIPEMLYIYICI